MRIILIGIIGMVMMIAIPMILICIYTKIDTELKSKIQPNKKDIIIIVIASAIISVTQWIMIRDIHTYIHTCVLMGYLLFMGYTDQKTKLLYSIISYIMIVLELITLIINWNNLYYINKYSTLVFILPLLLFILSLFRGIGLGDVLIYIVISLYSIQYSFIPLINVAINLLIAMAIFLICNVLKNIVTSDEETYRPFTVYIAFSTFLCTSFLA